MNKQMYQSTSQQSMNTVMMDMSQAGNSLPKLPGYGKSERKLYDSETLHYQKLDNLQAKFEQLVTKQKSTLN